MSQRENKARARGRHPDEITLQRVREGVSSERVRARVSGHLDGCEACRAMMDSYEHLDHLLSRCATAEVPVDLADEVIAKVLPVSDDIVVSARGSVAPTRVHIRGLSGAAAALTMAGLVLLWPVLSGFDSFAAQILGGLKAAIVNLHYFGRVIEGVQILFEPLRSMAMVFGALVTVFCAVLASRRYSRELLY